VDKNSLASCCKKDGATGPKGSAGKDGKTNVITANFTMGSRAYHVKNRKNGIKFSRHKIL
jgi:hypothetical protein